MIDWVSVHEELPEDHLDKTKNEIIIILTLNPDGGFIKIGGYTDKEFRNVDGTINNEVVYWAKTNYPDNFLPYRNIEQETK